MASNFRVSPPPVATEDTSIWAVWYIQVKDVINRIGESFSWSLLDFTGSNITDIITRDHIDLQNLQGGNATQAYHLTLAEQNAITIPKASATLDFPSIAAGAIATLTMTVTGAVAGSPVMLGPPAGINAGLLWSGFVSAANTVTIRLYNNTAAAIDPASATWQAWVVL